MRKEFDAIKVKSEIVEWIREYFEKNGPDSIAVVGISGGKDSSVVAALCVEALGKDRVLGVLMPCGEQTDISYSYTLCDFLAINNVVIDIKTAVDAEIENIKNAMESIPKSVSNVTIVNTPPRIRMTTLYGVSGSVNGRVANTCNLSEDYVGYSTKFGDSAGDFSPIMKLTVKEVKEVGRALHLPEKLIEKVPIDGLCGKTDEDNLGFTYETLDRYIRDGICEDKNIREKIDRMHEKNLHKLEPMPHYNL